MAGLTFKEILSRTPGDRLNLSRQVRITYLKYGMSKALGVPKAICQSHSVDQTKTGKAKPFRYVTMIEFYSNDHVKVSCSCADHLYRWEYALARKKASYITYSNGEAARIRNPRNITGCCKHVIALYAALRQKGLIPKGRQLPDVEV